MTEQFGSGTKTAGDSPSSFYTGVSYFEVSADDGFEGDGVLKVIRGGTTSGTTQVLYTYGQVWVRHTSGNSWPSGGGWSRLAVV